MKIFITGGLGHIGSYLLRELPLRLKNLEITVIDNLITQRYFSLFNLPYLAKYKFIEANIQDVDLIALVKDFDIVIHLAAITDAAGSFDNKEKVEANNFSCTRDIVKACSLTNTKLITLSSTSVYGTQSNLVHEDCDTNDLKPQSPYAETKLKEEKLVKQESINGNLKSIILRFGTIFGASPGMRFHTAVNKFCWQASQAKPISIWRTALNQKRPYLDLLDACRAITHIIENDIFDGQIYNVLTCNSTVKDIVNEITLVYPSLKTEMVDSKIMNQLSYEVCNKKFNSKGFYVCGDLRRGIRDTLNILSQSNSLIKRNLSN